MAAARPKSAPAQPEKSNLAEAAKPKVSTRQKGPVSSESSQPVPPQKGKKSGKSRMKEKTKKASSLAEAAKSEVRARHHTQKGPVSTESSQPVPPQKGKKSGKSKMKEKAKKASVLSAAISNYDIVETFSWPVLPAAVTSTACPKPKNAVVVREEFPRVISLGTLPRATGIASSNNGKLWVVYGRSRRRLDVFDKSGHICESKQIEERLQHITSCKVLREGFCVAFAYSASRSELMMVNSALKKIGVVSLSLTTEINAPVTSVSAGSSGIVVSFSNALWWISDFGNNNCWIIEPGKKHHVTGIRSTTVVIVDQRELVFAAASDTGEIAVYENDTTDWFYRPVFKRLPSLYLWHFRRNGVKEFRPWNISAHSSGLLGILNASEKFSVLIVDITRYALVAVIPEEQLCVGTPSVIAFTWDEEDREPDLWVATTSGTLSRTALTFQF